MSETHRLCGFELYIAPLRRRPADVDALAEAELALASRRLGGCPFELSSEGFRRLRLHDWPGNVRELRATLLRMTAVAGDRWRLDVHDVEAALSCAPPPRPRHQQSFIAREREELVRVLDETRWNVCAAARLLGIGRGAVRTRMKRCGLKASPSAPSAL